MQILSIEGGKSIEMSLLRVYNMQLWFIISFADTEGEEIGFAVDRHGSIANPGTSGSRKHYETVMTWRCEPDVNWDPSSNDVTLFAIDITYNYSSYSVSRLI